MSSAVGKLAPYLAGIPVVQTSSQRDAMFPFPDTDQRVQNKDTGNVERWDGFQWVADFQGATPPSVTGGNLQSITDVSFGALGNGTADDRAAFAAVTAAGSHHTFLPRGTYRIASDLTIDFPVVREKGATIKPDSGVTVTITGPFDPGLYQMFDVSAGGQFLLDGQIRAVYPQWFGAAGDGTTDDTVAFQAAVDATDASARLVLTNGSTFRVTNSIEARRRYAFHMIGVEFPDHYSGPIIQWDGPYGGRVMILERDTECVFEGFSINMDPDTRYTTRASATASSPTITIPDATGAFTFDVAWDGREVWIVGAGEEGSDLKAVIDSVDGTTQITLDRNVVTTADPTLIYIASATGGFPALAAMDFCGQDDATSLGNGAFVTAGSDIVKLFFDSSYSGASAEITAERGAFTYAFPDLVGRTITIDPLGAAPWVRTLSEYLGPLHFRLDSAIASDVDGLDWELDATGSPDHGSSIGTANIVRNLRVYSQVPHPYIQGLRISVDANTNHEFHTFENLEIQLSSSAVWPLTATTTNGSPTATISGLTVNHEGLPLHIHEAGAAGGTLRTTITRVVGSTITMADNAGASVAGSHAMVPNRMGYGLVIGFSANCHGHRIINTQINGMGIGILSAGGFDAYELHAGSGHGTFYTIWGTAGRSCHIYGDVVEGGERWMDLFGGSVSVIGCAPGGCYFGPLGAVIRISASTSLAIDYPTLDYTTALMKGDSTIVDLRDAVAGYLKLQNVFLNGNFTTAEFGLDTIAEGATQRVEIDIAHAGVITGLSGRNFFGVGGYWNTQRDITGPVLWSEKRGTSSGGAVAGRSSIHATTGSPSLRSGYRSAIPFLADYQTAHEFVLLMDSATDGTPPTEMAGSRHRMVLNGGSMPPLTHTTIASPENNVVGNVGGGNPLIGLRIEPQYLAGWAAAGGDIYAIKQEGTDDHNLLAGQTFYGIKDSAPTDADIPNNAGVFYMDAGTLKLRYRDNGGTLATKTLS